MKQYAQGGIYMERHIFLWGGNGMHGEWRLDLGLVWQQELNNLGKKLIMGKFLDDRFLLHVEEKYPRIGDRKSVV